MIGEFIQNLEEGGVKVPNEIKESVILSEYAVETRYPTPTEPVTKEEYHKAIGVAERVFDWTNEQITQQSSLF